MCSLSPNSKLIENLIKIKKHTTRHLIYVRYYVGNMIKIQNGVGGAGIPSPEEAYNWGEDGGREQQRCAHNDMGAEPRHLFQLEENQRQLSEENEI